MGNLKIIRKVLKHLRRYYPDYKFGFKGETKFFLEIYIEDPLLYCNIDFCKRRNLIRKVHGSKATKRIFFVRWKNNSNSRVI